MMPLRAAFVLGLALLLAGCDPALQNRFRTVGAGLDLSDAGLEARTEALAHYFDNLCLQADVPGRPCPTPTLSPKIWRAVVAAGYNDIDRRCDEYLSWVDEQRAQLLFANQGITALQGLVGGVLGLAAPGTLAVNYVALALGFTTSVYNGYQNLALLGIEASTIKTIVIERRLAFRKEFQEVTIASKPDAVYVLRNYLMLCTPQMITLDVNTYSRGAVSGEPVSATWRIEQMAAAIAPARAETSADVIPQRIAVRDRDVEQAIRTDTGGYERRELVAVQRALCVDPDGVFGPQTRAAIEMFERVRYGEGGGELVNARIDDVEFDILDGRVCERAVYRNFYEFDRYAADEDARIGLVEALNLALPDEPPLDLGTGFGDPEFRRRVAAARIAVGIVGPGSLGDQVTPDFVNRLRQI